MNKKGAGMLKSKIQNPKSNSCVLVFLCPCVYFVIFVLSFVILTSGCARLTESVKGAAGISTKILEKERRDALTKNFNYDYFASYTKTLDILRQTSAYVYAQDIKKNMIAIYVSEQDTTPVGLFFKEVDAHNTQIEVASPSTYAKELIAQKVFSALEK